MGQRLLVLDADEAFINEHRVALEFNFDVDFIDRPDDVVKLLEGGAYAVILIGVELASKSGYAVCADIRRKSSLRGFKVVLISSKATKAEFNRHKNLRVRADLYLRKPIASSKLISALESFVAPKAFAKDNTIDVLMEVDIGEEWLKSLDSAESAEDSLPLSVAPAENQQAALTARVSELESMVGELEAGLQVKTAELLNVQRENQELQRQNAEVAVGLSELEAGLQTKMAESQDVQRENQELRRQNAEAAANQRELEAELRVRMLELVNVQSENQELQRLNAIIAANLEELEAPQKNLETLKRRMREAESQIKYLESPHDLEKYADKVLRDRMKESVLEKKALLGRLEELTQEMALKNQEAIALIRAREDYQQRLLDVEEQKRRLEQEFEDRVECERKLMFSRMEDIAFSETQARKRVRELEELSALKSGELESGRAVWEEEKQRMIEDFETQRQNMISSLAQAANEDGS